jgi:cytochrome P450
LAAWWARPNIPCHARPAALIDALLAGPKPVDLVTTVALPVPTLVITELLGVPYEDHDLFRASEGLIFDLGAADWDPCEFPEPERLGLNRPARRHHAFGHTW